jgi:exopolyphosphatase / guanosine-5'-triphosphate,3'-diphosphate pyrophosphatase
MRPERLVKLAALDVGTNTVLLLVAETGPDGRVQPLADLARITRLGRGVDQTRRLDPDSAAATHDTVVEFIGKARSLGAERILTAATSALRDAGDGGTFIARVKAGTGVDLDVISGDTEACLCHLAVSRGLKIDPESKLLIVDIGGGSTELICAERGRKLETASLEIGSVRLTERIIHHDPPTLREATDLRLAIDRELHALAWNFAPDVMVGIAGTVTTVCAVALGLDTYDPALIHGHPLSRAEVAAVLEQVGSVALAERKKIPGIVEGRADVIFAGTALLERIMVQFGAESLMASDQGVRWGLIWRELDRIANV